MDIDDRTLISRCLSGDKEAFEPLVKRHSYRVFRIVYRFFNDPLVIEDIAQEVFFKAYTSLSTYRHESPFENWLSKIAVNMCYHYLRRQRSDRLSFESNFTDQDISLFQDISLGTIRTDAGDLSKRLMFRDLIEKIMQHLTAKEKMVLILSEVEGMSVQEIATLMGISSISVKVTKYRARKRALHHLKGLSRKTTLQKGGQGYERPV
jgi:RNA polymerase sigma-70 factor (ECF subfamily)